jgi:hypothetical protein
MKVWIDPPEGWRYGFPKIYDQDTDGTTKEFLIKNGYPEKLYEQLASKSTMWVRSWAAVENQLDDLPPHTD